MTEISAEKKEAHEAWQAYRADMQRRNSELDVKNATLRIEIENVRRVLRLMRDRAQLGDQHYLVETEVMGLLNRTLIRLEDEYGEKRKP